jgi:hypothetical protein
LIGSVGPEGRQVAVPGVVRLASAHGEVAGAVHLHDFEAEVVGVLWGEVRMSEASVRKVRKAVASRLPSLRSAGCWSEAWASRTRSRTMTGSQGGVIFAAEFLGEFGVFMSVPFDAVVVAYYGPLFGTSQEKKSSLDIMF